jgi:3-oxoacyl-(acyl-carrier-protein) synthase/acyl carrier protein
MSKSNDIAVIGMAVKLPGAKNILEFWDNLCEGVVSTNIFNKEDLFNRQGHDDSLINNENFIPSKGVVEDAEYFAADFFKIPNKQAEIMDPQIRVFLETTYHAWEDSGYDPFTYNGIVGVYASSCGIDTYYEKNILMSKDYNISNRNDYIINNSRDFLATQVAYRFNFTGPCLNIQTACSSSLVAICKGSEDLQNNICDIAVVGGVSLSFPLYSGYLYKEGMIYSKDGYCQPFSEKASGIVPGNGVGVVILKLFDQAIADGDKIYAKIKGFAVNNDGKNKLSFAAPNIEGQVEVVSSAIRNASIDSFEVDYIETHGTGTKLGDAIEIDALYKSLNISKRHKDIYIGSVKANIGHLDVASGIAGFIKSALMLRNKVFVPQANFEKENKDLKLSKRGIIVLNRKICWKSDLYHLCNIGVSSFGIGGTNAHVILEEHYCKDKEYLAQNSESNYVFGISSRNKDDLDLNKESLCEFININSDIDLRNLEHSLKHYKSFHDYRLVIMSRSQEELVDALYLSSAKYYFESNKTSNASICFIFNSCLELSNDKYNDLICEFQKTTNKVTAIFDDLSRNINYTDVSSCFWDGGFGKIDSVPGKLKQILTNYLVARLLNLSNIIPTAVIGSEPEGVLSAMLYSEVIGFDDLLSILLLVEKLKDKYTEEKSITIICEQDFFYNIYENYNLSLRFVESNNRFVISADEEKLKIIKNNLDGAGIIYLEGDKSFLPSVAISDEEFRSLFYRIHLNVPKFNIYGLESITHDVIAKKLFSIEDDILLSVSRAVQNRVDIFMDVACSSRFNNAIYQIKSNKKAIEIISLLSESDFHDSLKWAVARSWALGIDVDWGLFSVQNNSRSKLISLPPYEFTRRKYFITPRLDVSEIAKPNKLFVDNLLYKFVWKSHEGVKLKNTFFKDLIFFHNKNNFNISLLKEIESNSNLCLRSEIDEHLFDSSMSISDDWIEERKQYWVWILNNYDDQVTILYSVCLDFNREVIDKNISNKILFDLVALGKAVADFSLDINILFPSCNSIKINTSDLVSPYSSMHVGILLCISSENANLHVRFVDVGHDSLSNKVDIVLNELKIVDSESILAIRNGRRLKRSTDSALPDINKFLQTSENRIKIKNNGVYVITGGTGGMGLVLAEFLYENYKAKIILISRSAKDQMELSSEKCAIVNSIIARGGVLEFYSADVSNQDNMNGIWNQIENRYGIVSGVIHAASAYLGGLIKDKTYRDFKIMFNSKIDGLNVLVNILSSRKMDFLLLCSSVSATRGAIGASDYVCANIYFDSFASHNSGTIGFPIISVAWDALKDIGMRFDYFNNQSNLSGYQTIDFSRWKSFILDHKYNNIPLIPGALLLDMLITNIVNYNHDFMFPIVISDVNFVSPGFINDLENFEVRMHFSVAYNDVSIEIFNEKWLQIARVGSIQDCGDDSVDVEVFINMLADFDNVSKVDIPPRNNKHLYLGGQWDCLRWVKSREGMFLSSIVLPDEHIDGSDKFLLFPSLLDVAVSFFTRFLDKNYIPVSIGAIKIFGKLSINLLSLVHNLNIDVNSNICTCSVALFDDAGNVIFIADECVFKSVELSQVEQGMPNKVKYAYYNTNANRFGYDKDYGLTNAEVKEIFNKSLLRPLSHLIISKSPDVLGSNFSLEKRLLSNKSIDMQTSSDCKEIRRERSLSDKVKLIWSDVLGVSEIQDNDNFFDIGGDSLYSIEMSYRIHADLGINIGPQKILEKPVLEDFVNFISGAV